MTNCEALNKGFDLFLKAMVPQLTRFLIQLYGPDLWYKKGVRPYLTRTLCRIAPNDENFENVLEAIDIAQIITLLLAHWNALCAEHPTEVQSDEVADLKTIRNMVMHRGLNDIDVNRAYRALGTMQLLCAPFDREAARQLRKLKIATWSNAAPHRQSANHSEPGEAQSTETIPQPYQDAPRRRENWLLDRIHALQKTIARRRRHLGGQQQSVSIAIDPDRLEYELSQIKSAFERCGCEPAECDVSVVMCVTAHGEGCETSSWISQLHAACKAAGLRSSIRARCCR